MPRPGFQTVKSKLQSFKNAKGLCEYDIKDIVQPHGDIDGLAADFGESFVNDNWEREAKKDKDGNPIRKSGKIVYKDNDNAVKTSQIRKIYSEIKSMHIKYDEAVGEEKNEVLAQIEQELLLLMPKITFAKSRKSQGQPLLGKPNRNLGDIIILAIEACLKGLSDMENLQRHENFERLYQFMEALVAYHKQYSE